MTRANHLHAVPTPPLEDEPDVTMLLRAEIMKRDWAAVHTSADRRSPVCVGDARKRTWRR